MLAMAENRSCVPFLHTLSRMRAAFRFQNHALVSRSENASVLIEEQLLFLQGAIAYANDTSSHWCITSVPSVRRSPPVSGTSRGLSDNRRLVPTCKET
ncbi:hypothetical protein SUDANB180_00693 [Streptomyces sp. enrichment culture]